MSHPWIAARTASVDSSGIRKVFDLAAKMADPINLSIGQPDFAVPESIQQAAIDAIRSNRNGYSLTQGIPPLRDKLQARLDAQYGHPDRQVLVTSGTSGGLLLALLSMVDPGDEVICFDPYFVMYSALISMVGGRCVMVDTYPDFRIDLDQVAEKITPRTKLILLNSPANPTGIVATKEEVRGLAELAAARNIGLLSDEIYRQFCYGDPPASPATWNQESIILDGFSKTYGVTGWRLGWVHGPSELIDKMTMIQQYTFVCAPHPLQWAAIEALEVDMTTQVDNYRKRRDLMLEGLREYGYEVTTSGGAFYLFPKVPEGHGTGTQFVSRAIENQLLVIPGNIFSQRDTHFRISYAASMKTLERGLEVLANIS